MLGIIGIEESKHVGHPTVVRGFPCRAFTVLLRTRCIGRQRRRLRVRPNTTVIIIIIIRRSYLLLPLATFSLMAALLKATIQPG